MWLGPNAVLATALEGYRRGAVVWRELFETLAWPGTRRMMRRHWRAGAGELYRSARKRAFIAELQRYVPELSEADAVPAPAGVRAQAVDRDGSLVDDFRARRHRPCGVGAQRPVAGGDLVAGDRRGARGRLVD